MSAVGLAAMLGSGHASLHRPAARVRKSLADEAGHHLYLVEHDLCGLSSPQRATVHRALDEAVRRENQQGRQIRYVQRIYAPAEHRCLCLFEATGADVVRNVNDIAQFPLARVIAVVSSMPGECGQMAELTEQRPDDMP